MTEYNGLNEQPNITVPYAYGGGVATLTACPVCGSVVLGNFNQSLHDSFHENFQEISDWSFNKGRASDGT